MGKRYVVTGGMGFFGSILADYLVDQGHEVLSVDRLPEVDLTRRFKNAQLDITDGAQLTKVMKEFGHIDAVFHVAALLAHEKSTLDRLWASNVDGTRNVMQAARELGIRKVVFTSTNCVFSTGFTKPVDESTPTNPVEIYGRSKLAGEKVISEFADINSVIIRCPTIMAAGRLGLLTILFDFVLEGRRLYLVGDGSNRYSFIAAQDLANACLLSAQSPCSGIYHVSSDNVPTMYELYSDLVHFAGKTPRILCIPKGPTMLALKLLNALSLSPLGPYHYRMLAANFVFDTTKIKNDMGWCPTRTNNEILREAYQYYVDHLSQINSSAGLSAHKSKAKAGILNVLRMIS
jgi:nucleoside-diphosphate-sugar epimerase